MYFTFANYKLAKMGIILLIIAGLFVENSIGVPLTRPNFLEQIQTTNDGDCAHLKNIITLVRKPIHHITTCAVEGNFLTDALKSENHVCIVRCALTKIGILETDGTIDLGGVIKIVETSIPKSLQNGTSDVFLACHEAGDKITPNDTTCKSYEPLIQCVVTNLVSKLRNVISKVVTSGLSDPEQGRRLLHAPLRIAKCGVLAAHAEAAVVRLELKALPRRILIK